MAPHLKTAFRMHFGLGFGCLFASLFLCLPLLANQGMQTSGDFKNKLRQSGRHLELSASYKSELRIDSLSPELEPRFGDCSFYQDFIRLIDVDKSTAVEAKIRKLDLDEASRFIYLYSERLKSQSRWTESLGEKIDGFQNALGALNCQVRSELVDEFTDDERSQTQDD